MNIFALNNVPYNSLYASVSDTSTNNKASIYASFNRVPILDATNKVVGADISGCNGQYCTAVQSISTKNGIVNNVNGTWYITIVSGRDNNGYAFWYDNICPNNCSGEGNCGNSTANYGVCSCNPNYEGLTCSPNNMLIEYIILIIIAALVLVSALLGLIAWAYMRRRAQYVEVR